jgi:hypothetical protein
MSAATAAADWPVARHDPGRSGATSTPSNILAPAQYWRRYLGGTIASDGFLPFDVDGDGRLEAVLVSAGRLTAKRADDTTVWQTRPLEIQGLAGVGDLDGDGNPDLVGYSSSRVYVFAAATGRVQWAEQEGEMGGLGAVRLSDFNDDGRPDVLIQECTCCGVSSGVTGYAYSFDAEFAASRVWTAPPIICSGYSTTVFDGDGDGRSEVAISYGARMQVLDGRTGAILAETPSLGPDALVRPTCVPADVDGVPGEELVCVQNNYFPGLEAGRRVLVLALDRDADPMFDVRWQHDLGDVDGGDVAAEPDFIVDLDGDGAREVVASGMTAAGAWTTYVFDGADGAELARLPGQRMAGTAALETTGALVLTIEGTDLHAWGFSTRPEPALTRRWTLPDRRPLSGFDWDLTRLTTPPMARRSLLLDLDSDGIADLVTASIADRRLIAAYSAATGTPLLLGSHTFPELVWTTAAWDVPPFNTQRPQLAVARSDGYVTLFDDALHPADGSGGSGALHPADRGGELRVGGYCPPAVGGGPVAADLSGGGGAQAMMVVDSRGVLLRLDGLEATFASPPTAEWSGEGQSPSIIADLAAGGPGVVYYRSRDTTRRDWEAVALSGDNTPLWTAPLPDGPVYDMLPATIDGDGVVDLVGQTVGTGVVATTHGLSGRDGTLLWSSTGDVECCAFQPFAASDWNGDGKTDVLTVVNNLRLISGADGSHLVDGGTHFAYGMPVAGDGADHVVLTGSYYSTRALQHDLTTPVWVDPEDDRPSTLGALAACPDGPVLVGGSLVFPSRLKMTLVGSGASTTLVLASGQRYDDASAAQEESALLGTLGNVTVGNNLTGGGHPTALVGSSSGWLYGVDPCTGELDFAVDFQAPVCESILADTDRDGHDEILVTAFDGYLYGLKHASMRAPGFVWDIDPASGRVDADVASIETTATLSGRWGAVEGATGYQVSVVSSEGLYISSPHWQDVGAVTQVSVTGLPLEDGHTYRFAVRALSATGPSPDVVSNGVFVRFPVPGIDAGTPDGVDSSPETASSVRGGGCTCDASGSGSPVSGIVPLVTMLVAAATRARRRRGHP